MRAFNGSWVKARLRISPVVVCAGNTPPRTDYEYNKDISKPLIHKKLLDTFRADRVSRDEDMAINLALPLSDSEDEGQMATSTDEQELSDGANVSFIN